MENLPHFRRIDLVYFSLPGFESVFYEMAEGTSRKAVYSGGAYLERRPV